MPSLSIRTLNASQPRIISHEVGDCPASDLVSDDFGNPLDRATHPEGVEPVCNAIVGDIGSEPRNPREIVESPRDTKMVPKDDASEAGHHYWICFSCEESNQSTLFWCSKCGRERNHCGGKEDLTGEPRPKESAPDEKGPLQEQYWRCPHCATANARSRSECNSCCRTRDWSAEFKRSSAKKQCVVDLQKLRISAGSDHEPTSSDIRHGGYHDNCDVVDVRNASTDAISEAPCVPPAVQDAKLMCCPRQVQPFWRVKACKPVPHDGEEVAYETAWICRTCDEENSRRPNNLCWFCGTKHDIQALQASQHPIASNCSLNRSEEICEAEAAGGTRVTLHVYNVSKDKRMKKVNDVFRAVGAGAYHAGVEVYDLEWSYGWCQPGLPGVAACKPKRNSDHRYRESISMGTTRCTKKQVAAIIEQFKNDWPGHEYDFLRHNCCHFADALCHELGLGPMPQWLTRLAGAAETISSKWSAATDAVHEAAGAAADMAAEIDAKYKILDAMDAFANHEIRIDDAYFESKVQNLLVQTVQTADNAGFVSAASRLTDTDNEIATVCQCAIPGCTRPSWNGQRGEACCRTCGANSGRFHGEVCNARSDCGRPRQVVFTVGERVQKRDAGKDWTYGYVTQLDPLKVTFADQPFDPNNTAYRDRAYSWHEVRRAKARVFVKGEPVNIFSRSEQKWFDGDIVEAFPTDCIFDGLNIKAGTLLVSYSGRSKYVLPQDVDYCVAKACSQI